MELSKDIKENVEKAESKEQSKVIKANAEMELTDEKMDQVAGGIAPRHSSQSPLTRSNSF